jgi:hypothetical protein
MVRQLLDGAYAGEDQTAEMEALRPFDRQRLARVSRHLLDGGTVAQVCPPAPEGASLGKFLSDNNLGEYTAHLLEHGLLWGDLHVVSEPELMAAGMKPFHVRRLLRHRPAAPPPLSRSATTPETPSPRLVRALIF